jgi:hypothetical protein
LLLRSEFWVFNRIQYIRRDKKLSVSFVRFRYIHTDGFHRPRLFSEAFIFF